MLMMIYNLALSSSLLSSSTSFIFLHYNLALSSSLLSSSTSFIFLLFLFNLLIFLCLYIYIYDEDINNGDDGNYGKEEENYQCQWNPRITQCLHTVLNVFKSFLAASHKWRKNPYETVDFSELVIRWPWIIVLFFF